MLNLTIGIDELDGNNRRNYIDDDDDFIDADGEDDETASLGGIEKPGEKRRNMVDNPLDRRALQSLEKQLQLEVPESHFDLGVSVVVLMQEFLNILKFPLPRGGRGGGKIGLIKFKG